MSFFEWALSFNIYNFKMEFDFFCFTSKQEFSCLLGHPLLVMSQRKKATDGTLNTSSVTSSTQL